MSKIQYILVLDLETSNLDPRKAAITEIGCAVFREDTLMKVDEFQTYIKPYNKNISVLASKKKMLKKKNAPDEEPELMEYNTDMMEKYTGITMNMLQSKGIEYSEASANFLEFLSKYIPKSAKTGKLLKSGRLVIAGQRIIFDIGFIQQMAAFNDWKMEDYFAGTKDFYGNHMLTYLDTLPLARLQAGDRDVSCKLGEIADRMGVELYDSHSALGDVAATADILVKFVQRIRSDSETSSAKQKKTRDDFYFKIKENTKE